MTPDLGGVPLELIEEVFDGYAESLQPDYPTLRALILVCRALHTCAQLNLYHRVIINTPEQLQAFVETKHAFPTLAHVVRELTVSPKPHAYVPLGTVAGLLLGVQVLKLKLNSDLAPPTYNHVLTQFRGVHTLVLSGMLFWHNFHLQRLLHAFNWLRHLTILRVGISS
ncbi:hypothetical protein BD413DRAFT_608299 [Trametes elegans]|nr:hypothetical protein BD413DRAFT_608299 [Trametes elegans]